MHRMIPFPRQPDEDRVDLFGCLASPLPEFSDIMVKESNAADAALSPGVRAGLWARGADGLCFSPHKDTALTPSAVCHCTQNQHLLFFFFLLAVSVAGLNNPEPVPGPWPGAPLRLFIKATTYSGL